MIFPLANSVDHDQAALTGAASSGSALFENELNGTSMW